MTATVHPYSYPRSLETASELSLSVNGTPVRILKTSAGCFAQWEMLGAAEVRLSAAKPLAAGTLHPLARCIPVAADAGCLCVRLERPGAYFLEVEGLPALYLFAEMPETDRPDPLDPRVRYFAGGQVYEVGLLRLGSGETLYIEGGAVLRGAILVSHAARVRIRGRGIIDNRHFPRGGSDGTRRAVFAEFCQQLEIEGVILIEPQTWTLEVAGLPEVVDIHGIKILGSLLAAGRHRRGRERARAPSMTAISSAQGDDCVALTVQVEYLRTTVRRNPDLLPGCARCRGRALRAALLRRGQCARDRARAALQRGRAGGVPRDRHHRRARMGGGDRHAQHRPGPDPRRALRGHPCASSTRPGSGCWTCASSIRSMPSPRSGDASAASPSAGCR